jgi:probable HAF family extracellular repeat protein
MKPRALISVIAIAVMTAITIPIVLAAQDAAVQGKKAQHHHYKLIDMGTFGGPQSYLNFYSQVLSPHGVVAGYSDTTAADPNFPNFGACFNPDCLFSHAFQWQKGTVTDLGALTNSAASAAFWISDNGLIVGESQNGLTDPITGLAEVRAVLWQNGQIGDLGTLGGNESGAFAVNSYGQVVGAAGNPVSDPYSMFGLGTQTRAFLWQNGKMTDLGTLGGTDAFALGINEHGWVTGPSYSDSNPSANCPWPLTTHPFLVDARGMRDLGTLGGSCAFPNVINKLGQVAGDSNLTGDTALHPFLWDGEKMIDLGSFGGTSGDATFLNDAGVVVGSMNLQGDQMWHAFRWKDGKLHDLGTLDKCSTAWGINSKGQIVGASGDCGVAVHAFLWEDGQMIDLTKLIPPHIELTYALSINDDGQIAAIGRVPGGGDVGIQHAFLLTPADDNDAIELSDGNQDRTPVVEEPRQRGRFGAFMPR